MTDAPERIWMPLLWEVLDGTIPVDGQAEDDDLEYIRSDLVQELIRAAVEAETERCISALTATCDAEIGQAKKLGPMHVPIIISVKHDCISAIRGPKP